MLDQFVCTSVKFRPKIVNLIEAKYLIKDMMDNYISF